MNFHKTIGFLASLLLVLGIGVPDSFAQDVKTVEVSPSRVTEGQTRGLTVTVTLTAAATSETTVTVTHNAADVTGVALNDDAGSTVTFTDVVIGVGQTSGMSTTSVTVGEDSDTNTADDNYNHPRDKMVTITASDGSTSAEKMLTVREDDLPVGAITLTADPSGISVGGSGQTVTLTASIPKAPGTNNTVSVSFATAHSNGVDGNGGTAAAAEIVGAAKMSTSDLSGMVVTDAGSVTVTASAVGYTPGMATVSIISRSAEDVEGFRVTIASHADGAWAGHGANKVMVHVTRLNAIAYPWTAFESVAVGLRDTATVTGLGSGATEGNIVTLTASGFAMNDENVVFSTAAVGGGDANAANRSITYEEANDRLVFSFSLPNLTGTTSPTDSLGTLPSGHPQIANDALGRRLHVFARATFTSTVDGTVNTVVRNSNDTKMKVFDSPSTLGTVSAADQVVGDGKLIKFDLISPGNDDVMGLVTTVEGNMLSGHNDHDLSVGGKIGDDIKVAVGIGSQTRYRDAGVQIQIAAFKGTDASGNANNATLKTVNFTQLQVINAANDSLRTSLELTEGLIKTKAVADGNTRDGGKIKKNALFEPDNINIRVRARSKDQAGNWSGWVQHDFKADTRKPGIIVLNPADGGRFSGAHKDADVDIAQYLKPLQLRVDEEITSLSVYAKGAYSAKDEKADASNVSIIHLWTGGNQDLDISQVVGDAGDAVGDTIAYDTRGLKWRKGNGDLAATGQGGTKIDLVIEATDVVGNKATKTVPGVFHDEKVPTISDFFPTRELLADDDYQINDATRHPVFTLKEAVDSLAIVYDPSSGSDIMHVVADGLPKGEHQEIISEAFVHDRTYSLTIFARDLAGNAFETPSADAADLRFNEQFDNPMASTYKITYAETDSVIAGQVNDITIQAFDNNGTADDDDDRNALTHKGPARISAWDADGGMASSVRFHGGGVTDNGDGSAMLNNDAWKLGKRTVKVMSNKAIGLTKLLVQNMETGEDGTQVATFDGAAEGFYVGAADFVGFEITAWQDGNDVSARGITGDFDLLVVPVDRYGNTSVRAYKGATGKKSEADSLAILDTRVKNNGIEYKNGIDVTFVSIPFLEELTIPFPIELGGTTYPILLPDGRRSLTIRVSVDNDNLHADDMRSVNVKDTKLFNIVAPLMPELTLWVPGSDVDEAGNDVEIPADPGNITVTVAAEGYNAGSMVTFTKNGTMMDPVAADDDGVARLMITMSEAGSVTVSATDGDWPSDELTITFVEGPDEPARMAYVDDNGDPVYLIADGDMTVGVDDFQAFVMAYGSSAGDDNYNLQADINDDGEVDVDDFLEFIPSWGRTATGPATKPIVLLPGINENAEFSLSLGSERVVAGEFVAVDVSLANVEAVMGYGFTLNYDMDKFEFVSVASAGEDLLASTGGETLFHHVVADGQVTVANGLYNGTAVSGGGDIVRFVFRVLYEFEDNARFEIADGLVFDPSQLSNPAVVAGVLELQSTPREFALHQNFPNPFNPDTTINYDLAESADVTLQIYNVLGQVVRTLVASEAQNAGRYQIRWNGMDDRGVPVSSGIYFYQISADGKFSDVRKLMLLK